MSQVELRDAAVDLADLVRRARAGEEIVLAEAGLGVAKLIPLDVPAEAARPKRRLGRLAGTFSIPADFDAPLPDDLLDLFEGDPAAVARDRARLAGRGGDR